MSRSDVTVINQTLISFLDRPAVRFAIVGGVGFVVNFGSLYATHGILRLPLLPAQLISSELAILVSFVIHHNWTYRNFTAIPLYKRLVTFNISSVAGALATTLGLFLAIRALHVHYLVGLIFGAFCGLVWNYFSNKHFIWKKSPPDAGTAIDRQS